jgi:hypothetical protein
MKNMNYFIRPEHFEAIGKLMLIISMTWAYFFFNDYIVQWYGGDKWTKDTAPLARVWSARLDVVCRCLSSMWHSLGDPVEPKMAFHALAVRSSWAVDQRGHVVRALRHRADLADHQPHAVHLA